MTRRLVQLLRRTVQLGVIAFVVYTALGGAWRNYKVAHNNARLVGLFHGDVWAWLYSTNEDMLGLLGEPYRASLKFLGLTWSSTVFGLESTDPVLAAAHIVSSWSLPTALLAGALLPLVLALLLGKVFCSHLCPMRLMFEIGQLARKGLVRLGVELPELRHPARFGGWVLLGGLLATAAAGSGVWLLILPYLSLSASIFVGISMGVTTGLLAVVIGWFVIDALIAPGYFCHNLCPTGFVLEQVGRFSLLRLKKKGRAPCPSKCKLCQLTCPYGLRPMDDVRMPACDSCGRCVVVCPRKRLGRRLALPSRHRAGAAVLVLVSLLAPRLAAAHHNKGLPHYGYFKNYPQVPTEEYVAIQGRWEIGATMFNFQGLDRRTADTPNDVKIYLYLYDMEHDRAYRGKASFEIRQDGELVSRFSRQKVDEEATYSTRETLPRSGDYELVARIPGGEAVLPFHIELASDRINWWLVGGLGGPVLLVFGLALYGRSRKRRRRPRAVRAAANAIGALWLVSVGLGGWSGGAPAHAAAGTSQRVGKVCPHCGMVGCTMDHSADAARAPMKHYRTEDGQVMVMGGIPLWLFLTGIGGIILVSFVATERLAPAARRGFRLDLTRDKRVYRLLRSRWLQAVPQTVMVGVLSFLVFAGLFGSRVANLTPVAVWTVWWAALIFFVLLLASAWCFVCPWDGLANLVSRLRVAARVDTLSLGLRYPDWLKNLYPAIALFVALTWLELGFGVTSNPRWTAYMGIGMAAMACVAALLWDGKKFCAHLCPVGRICGIYSNFSPVEIRARNPKTCEMCKTEDCRHGNEHGYPCPTGLSLKASSASTLAMASSISTLCTNCTECIKSCNKHNVAIRLRPFAADLRNIRNPRRDEAWLALMLLALTLFHGLSMTPVWENHAPGGASVLKWMGLALGTSKTVNFTTGMVVALAIPVVLYALSCRIAAAWAGEGVSWQKLFCHFAYSLLPVALFYHLAHNLMHLLMEGGSVVPLLSDPLGNGADYLGTRGTHVGSLVSDTTLWYLQVGLILVGHVYGILVAHRIGHRLYRDKRNATRSLTPMLAMMILLSVGALWLMHLDMNMRVGRM